MRFLFIVQGEGRGHMTQSIALSDILRHGGHQIVEVLLGYSEMRKIPDFFTKHFENLIRTYDSPNFLKTKDNKHFLIFRSFIHHLKRKKRKAYFNSIRFISERIHEVNPDIVINFYELLGGLVYNRYKMQVPMVCVAHQFIFEHPDYAFRRKPSFTQRMLRCYTRLCSINASKCIALSFSQMPDHTSQQLIVFPPLLRNEVLNADVETQPFLLGYLLNHGFSEEVIQWHSKHPDVCIHVFWDKPDMPEIYSPHPNLFFHQLDDESFIGMMKTCRAFFGTAGFESVSEALYLNKPVLIVPAHAEQELNAFDAWQTGKVILASSFDLDQLMEIKASPIKEEGQFQEWVRQSGYLWNKLWEELKMENGELRMDD
ncbi:MAG: glycosyltransferase [Bacteroidales bacterium]|jgi:uncharacterized protein (TIGR00661 family)|nr:glycosyltransferase [Bacteroidales bacterium]